MTNSKKIYIASYTDDENEHTIIGAFTTRKAATQALVDEFQPVWEMAGNARPATVGKLNSIMDWCAEVIETELR